MKKFLFKTAAAFAALILTACILSPAAYGLRVYDATAQDYPAFSAAARGKRTRQTESTLIVKTDGTLPDFRALHPQQTVQGPDDVYTVTFSSADEAADKLSDVCALRGVEYAEPNARVFAQTEEPTAAEYLTYGMELMCADRFAADLALQPELQPVLVGVVDSGLDASLSVFDGRLVEGATMNGSSETKDDYGHGTEVAGIVADCTQGLPVQIMPVRVLGRDGTGSILDAANGIKYAADQGAQIINLSFVSEDCSQTLHDAVDHAIGQGALPVISAGNYALDMDRMGCCPADYAPGFVVSGCDRDMQFYTSSCYGTTVDVCAPGVSVKCHTIYGNPMSLTGTSFAAPHVSAIAALYKLYKPDADRVDLEQMLTRNTRDLGDPGFDRRFGHGLPDLAVFSGKLRTITDVQLLHAPNKTKYYYKEPFSSDGFLMRIRFSDGTSEKRAAQGVQFIGTESMKRGTHTIRARYQGFEVSFKVTVEYRWWQWLVKIFLFGWLWY